MRDSVLPADRRTRHSVLHVQIGALGNVELVTYRSTRYI